MTALICGLWIWSPVVRVWCWKTRFQSYLNFFVIFKTVVYINKKNSKKQYWNKLYSNIWPNHTQFAGYPTFLIIKHDCCHDSVWISRINDSKRRKSIHNSQGSSMNEWSTCKNISQRKYLSFGCLRLHFVHGFLSLFFTLRIRAFLF